MLDLRSSLFKREARKLLPSYNFQGRKAMKVLVKHSEATLNVFSTKQKLFESEKA